MNYKEAVIAAVKYGETVPVLVNGKRVKISVAEKPRAPPGQVRAMGTEQDTVRSLVIAPSPEGLQENRFSAFNVVFMCFP